MCLVSTFGQNAVFLHHSTGYNVYYQGNVAPYITDYNTSHSTAFSLVERSFPDTPWDWANYPYDYWKLWIGGSCNSANPNIECLRTIASTYDLVIFKHCFPGAGIEEDLGTPDVNSDRKSLENYKVQYRALRGLMDSFPSTKFMVWTLTPLHRLATDSAQASRAKKFVDWVKNTWLIEDGKEHSNIEVFDFYSLIAELSSNPVNGQQYCLKYDYEGDHFGSDSHPNTAANIYVGPIFAQAVIDALQNPVIVHVDSILISGQGGSNAISSPGGSLQLVAHVFPSNATNDSIDWNIQNQIGQAVINSTGLVTALANGHVTIIATARDGSGISGKFVINISGQSITSNYNLSKSDFRFYINENELFISSGMSTLINQAKIYNSNGILVLSKNINNTRVDITLEDIVPGIYFVQLLSQNSVDILRVIKP